MLLFFERSEYNKVTIYDGSTNRVYKPIQTLNGFEIHGLDYAENAIFFLFWSMIRGDKHDVFSDDESVVVEIF